MVGRIRAVSEAGAEIFLAVIGAWFILAIVVGLLVGAFIRTGRGPE